MLACTYICTHNGCYYCCEISIILYQQDSAKVNGINFVSACANDILSIFMKSWSPAQFMAYCVTICKGSQGERGWTGCVKQLLSVIGRGLLPQMLLTQWQLGSQNV